MLRRWFLVNALTGLFMTATLHALVLSSETVVRSVQSRAAEFVRQDSLLSPVVFRTLRVQGGH